ncbi:MAG: ferrous iron transporter B [Phycisphaerae bacterium]|nr:ferrous iron transporter B [Phycisphaerae bacterium]
MSGTVGLQTASSAGEPAGARPGPAHVALLGNPNTGKTTLFNRLTGLRHKTSNFPGTTLEARVGRWTCAGEPVDLTDLPGVYSLELDQMEAGVCRDVLAGQAAPQGRALAAPDAVLVVADATNLARNLVFAGEALRRRLPTVVAVNMADLARKQGVHIDAAALSEGLGCPVVLMSARSGEGLEVLSREMAGVLATAAVPTRTPPGDPRAARQWAEELYASCASGTAASASGLTDRLDRAFTHPVLGVGAFVLIMAGLFYALFSLAQVPMHLIDTAFAQAGEWVRSAMAEGLVREMLSDGVIAGIGATVNFLPQICLLFFLISILEDTGYLARAALLMDRVLRPFGLRGHSFLPLLSSHACALPGIMSARCIPDPRERLATILVAPFMTCSARLPVYVLLTTLLFPGRPMLAALAFIGCYALGMVAGVLSALAARRTILRGGSRPMALELPTYKWPSLRTAAITAVDRGWGFIRNAGTNILAICILLWWLGAFPVVEPPSRAVELGSQAAELHRQGLESDADAASTEAAALEAMHAKRESFLGRMGRAAQPVFEPLGFDWQLTVGVLASFAAREVFVSTMSVVTTGVDGEGVAEELRTAVRDDGRTPVFTARACWTLLVYYVLAMQCLPTLAVTARESGHVKWALVQLGWMSVLAYACAWLVGLLLRAGGVA